MHGELPECRHRGDEIRRGQWACCSPKLVITNGSVTAEDCNACRFADHPYDPVQAGAGRLKGLAISDPLATALHRQEVVLQPATLAIAMITAPRSVRTIDASLATMRRGGFSQTIEVFAEPGVDLAPQPNITVFPNPTRLGAWRNWRQAGQWLLANTTAPFLMVCEDDIRLSADAALGLQHAIDTLPHEDWGFASLYTPRWNLRQHLPKPGWQAVDLRIGGWGSLAFCFTRDSLAELLTSTEPQSERSASHADVLATVVFGALGRRCYFHLPSLCMHTGEGISTLGHKHSRQTVAVGFQAEASLYRPGGLATTEIAPRGVEHAIGASVSIGAPAVRSATDFSDATVCVTVLFRFDRLQVLLRSIRRFYAKIEIIVADNSFRPEDWGKHDFIEFRDIVVRHGARPVLLPFDSGISATRNAAVTAARTPYVIVCEEDFEFTQRTNLEKLLRPIRAGEADFVGGLEHYTNPSNSWVRACVPPHLPPMVQYAAHVEIAGPWPRRRLVLRPVNNRDMNELSGVICRRADVIHNFYAARRDVYLLGPCDDRIKVCEHLDHFLRLKERGARVYYTPEAAVDHYTPGDTIDPRFQRLRHGSANYHQCFCDNWGLDPASSKDFGLLVGLTPVPFIER
ncbi:MAG: glycosyltransferase [Thermoguttaceae bacterium]